MSFTRVPVSLNGCSCERRGTGLRIGRGAATSFGALGDAVTDAQAAAAGASAALAKASASIPAFAAQVVRLKLQVERFGASPKTLVAVPSSVLDVATAGAAIGILQQRYLAALMQFPGESQVALSRLAQVTGAQAMVDPVGFIINGGVDGVQAIADLLQNYGDSKSLPPARSVLSLGILGGDSMTTVLVAGGALGALYLWHKHAKKRGR